MERGYVKLWRNIEDTGLLQNPTAWQVYTWLMFLAAIEETNVMISPNTMITLKSGEIVFSRAMLVRELLISEQQARTAMKTLEMLGLVTFKSTNRYTLASIVNWEELQNAE